MTPAKRGKGRKTGVANDNAEQTSAERHAAMTWAQRLKRVFDIDIETYSECGGDIRITVPAHPCAHGISASMHVSAGVCWTVMPTTPISPRRPCPPRMKTHQVICSEAQLLTALLWAHNKAGKVMTLQTIPDCGDGPFTIRVANVADFSLRAGVARLVALVPNPEST